MPDSRPDRAYVMVFSRLRLIKGLFTLSGDKEACPANDYLLQHLTVALESRDSIATFCCQWLRNACLRAAVCALLSHCVLNRGGESHRIAALR